MRLQPRKRSTIPYVHRVLVTGAAGFIGSHLVERLLSEDYEVIGYDNFSSGHKFFLKDVWTHPNFFMVEGDIMDEGLLASAMTGCDLVCHLAGNANLQIDIRQPALDLTQNTTGTLRVLQAMLECGVGRLFFPSSSAVYGADPLQPVPELTGFPKTETLHGTAKLACEGLIRTYALNFRLQAVILRASTVLGPRSRADIVSDIYRKLVINPAEFRMPVAPNQRLSFTHVADVVDAAFQALSRPATRFDTGRVEVYNAGNSELSRFSDVVRLVCRKQGLMPSVKLPEETIHNPYQNQAILLDTYRLRETGWVSRYSIQDGVFDTVDWLRRNHWSLGSPFDELDPPTRLVSAPNLSPPAAPPAEGNGEPPARQDVSAQLHPGS